MLYAWINGEKRPPIAKGESTTCPDCGGMLTSVIPVENVKHWRHKAGDCDPWSEPEGPWHLGWKETFPKDCREIGLIDAMTGERHRADVLARRMMGGVPLKKGQYALCHLTREEFIRAVQGGN